MQVDGLGLEPGPVEWPEGTVPEPAEHGRRLLRTSVVEALA